MARSYDSDSDSLNSEIVGWEVWPEGDFPAESPLEHTVFYIEVTTFFFLRSVEPHNRGSTPCFRTTFPLLLHELLDLTFEATIDMLEAVHVYGPIGEMEKVVTDIIEFCCQMAFELPSHGSVIHVSASIDLLVDEIPYHDDYEDEEQEFWDATEGVIEGLERMSIGSDKVDQDESENEKPNCVVCLEDLLAGSEATRRLPCSHSFHGDCIAKWLSTSKFCPLCRFELPST